MRYQTKGTCSTYIDIELDGDIIRSVSFFGGCNGNLQGISKFSSAQAEFLYDSAAAFSFKASIAILRAISYIL